jgi:hypothetical protein
LRSYKLKKIVREIQADVVAIEKNEALYQEPNFFDRVEAIDSIEFHIIDRIESLLPTSDQVEKLTTLKRRAELTRKRLGEVNEKLFRRLRASIASGDYTGADLKRQFDEFVERAPNERSQDDVGYDSFDVFVNGLLRIAVAPEETREREPEMVFYQPTPARIVFELVEKADIREDDVFYDLGSGLGQVPILVSLLSGARTKGIEFEPAYCDYAQQCARRLGLSRVAFINMDAREADYSDGTIFFMYTPFEGRLLREVLEKLKGEAQKRAIRVCTYGPCTLQVSNQNWLKRVDQNANLDYNLAIFRSV